MQLNHLSLERQNEVYAISSYSCVALICRSDIQRLDGIVLAVQSHNHAHFQFLQVLLSPHEFHQWVPIITLDYIFDNVTNLMPFTHLLLINCDVGPRPEHFR